MQTLTKGKPGGVLLRFALPIFAGNILQQVYQMVDNVIIGRLVGPNAFAAVGATYGIFFLISGFIWGTTAGFTVLTAQKYGEGDAEKTRQTIGTALWLSAVLTALMTAATVAGMPGLLRLLQMPDEIYAEAYSYIVVICAGLAAQVFYNLLAGILRAVGNSKIPLAFLIVASLLNIVLDLVFIVPLGMGAGGAALATVISQGVSGLLCLGYMAAKVPYLRLTRDDLRFRWVFAKTQLRTGIPMALQYAVTSAGMLVLQTSVNLLGTAAVTAYSAGNKIDVILEQGPIAIGSAMAIYTAQNLGAGEMGRIRQGVRAAHKIMLAYFVLFGSAAAFFGKYAAYLFVAGEAAAILDDVDLFLKIVSASGMLLGVLCIYRNTLQGMGYGGVSLLGGVVELIARSVVAAVSIGSRTFFSVCMGYPAAWLFAAAFFVGVYCVVMRKTAGKEPVQITI